MLKFFYATVFSLIAFAVMAQQEHLQITRANPDPAYEPFYHGVASGDPLTDRVIIWTRITTESATASVDWEVATDKDFNTIVRQGSVLTNASTDYTVKVDVTGLQPNTWYYYRFKHQNATSLVGRTRTTPIGDVDNLRIAVVACSNFQSGYFHAYREIGKRNDLDAVLHLGDYIYEYGVGGFGSTGDTARAHRPPTEILSLSDYRMRHSQYRLDADLRLAHQQYPFICVWDDHELANDAWREGAQNHDPATEGDFFERKEYAQRAYVEWMPIRVTSNDTIHRTIPFGNLADIIMIDTRLQARDEQVGGTGTAVTNPLVNDTSRTLLGPIQLDWFKQQLLRTAQWKVVGNQVMMAPFTAFGTLLNTDQWDGYPVERQKIFDFLGDNSINNFVVVTGDIHTSWGNDLPRNRSTYNATTGASSVGVEFVCTSVTSPGSPQSISNSLIQGQNPHMKYIELTRRGYLLLDVNKQRTQGDWFHLNTVTDKQYTINRAASYFTNSNENFLRLASAGIPPRNTNPDPAPQITSAFEVVKDFVVLSCYPNPFEKDLSIQYYLFKTETLNISIFDMSGKVVFSFTEHHAQPGLYNMTKNISHLPSGNYRVNISGKSGTASRQIFKK